MNQDLQQIKKAKSGDTGAFAELYRTIYADLYRFALYTLKNPADAEDAVSETSMDLAEGIDLRTQFFRLKNEERLIISMHVFAGYSSREIAGILHMNANTVRSKESRALKKLLEQLSDSDRKER